MSFPDCSIARVKPIIEPIEYDLVQEELKKRSKITWSPTWGKCCICGNVPIKKVSYPIQGAVMVQRYCDSCLEKQFSRIYYQPMSRYMEFINGKTGALADARRKWKCRLRKYKP